MKMPIFFEMIRETVKLTKNLVFPKNLATLGQLHSK